MAAYAGKKLSAMTAGERAKRIAQLVATHNTSAIKDAKYLPAKQRQQRELNTRLNSPIVAGSTVTNRDLAHQRQAATDIQFGPNAIAKQQQQATDVGGKGGFYDQYLAELAKHSTNVQGINTQAQTNLTNLGSSVRGLDQSQLNQQVGSAQADASSRGATVDPSLGQRGSDASAVRQALLASMQAVQNQQGANASTYADALAHVVGPAQKLQGQAQEQGKVSDLKQKVGSFGTSFDATKKADEAKTVLANQALGLNAVKATNTVETAAASRKAASHKWSASVNKYGVTNGAWADWGKNAEGKAKRQAAIDSYGKKSGKDVKPVSGPGSAGAANEPKIVSQVLKVAQVFKNGIAPQYTITQYGQKVLKSPGAKGVAAVKKALAAQNLDPRVIAAAESVYRNNGAVGPNGVKQLHSLGVHVGGHFKVVNK